MPYSPRFQYNSEIVNMIAEIHYLRGIIDSVVLPKEQERKLRDDARVKSAHYSTAMEGNPLSLDDVIRVVETKAVSEKQSEQEVRNYWRALDFLAKAKKRRIPITEEFIRRLHAVIDYDDAKPPKDKKISSYRYPLFDRPFGVWDAQKNAYEYLPPPAREVPRLMAELVEWVNSEEALSMPTPVRAAIFAYRLVAIHPFFDGNGRLCRAMSNYIMMLDDYDLNGYYSIEEHYCSDLDEYYNRLQMGLPVEYEKGRHDPDLTPWITYFLRTTRQAYRSIAKTTQAYTEQAKAKLVGLGQRERELIKYMIRLDHRPMKPATMADLFGVSRRTILYWLEEWVRIGLIEPASGKERITSYRLAPKYQRITLEDLGINEDESPYVDRVG